MAHTGGCLCGAIRYSITAPINELRACHCVHCQRASGSHGTVAAFVPRDGFKLTKGTLKRFSTKADSGRTLFRYFCGDCGSPIYSQRAKTPEMMVLKVGTLDAPINLKVVMTIWTNSARPWLYQDPTIEHYPENRPIKA